MIFAYSFIISSQSHASADCAGVSVCSGQLEHLLREEQKAKSPSGLGSRRSELGISVDGQTILGSPQIQGRHAIADKQLNNANIQIKFDGLDVTRRLTVSTLEARNTYQPEEVIQFVSGWNYPTWIKRAEIRIYKNDSRGLSGSFANPVAQMPVSLNGFNGHAEILADKLLGGVEQDEFVYVLRVYDENGQYDETAPLPLSISSHARALDRESAREAIVSDLNDQTAISNIPLYGGMVTVYGERQTEEVRVSGYPVRLDRAGKFVISQILPPGQHTIDVALIGSETKHPTSHIERSITIPSDDWFFVGLADLTIGLRTGEQAKLLEQTRPEEFSRTYSKGRLAMYLKGKVKGRTLITAAFDTDEKNLENLFSGLNERDPRQLLRTLDPDDFYPVYGDDSTTVEDAPTSGKFYLRIERGKNHVLWGNYKTRISGTELSRYERGLYGVHTNLQSQKATSHGGAVAKFEGFAARPNTLPQRNEFRGTGGSAFFMKQQDIMRGSEQVAIEERHTVTGEVVNRTLLRPGEDYEFDHMQGVVILKSTLAATTASQAAVNGNSVGGYEQYLVVNYEYQPALGELDGMSYGGRGQAWLNDNVRVGATGYSEGTDAANQELLGADMKLRLSEKSFIDVEYAQTRGNGHSGVSSSDGGLIFNTNPNTGSAGNVASSVRAKANLDLGEITVGKLKGSIGGYFEDLEQGFNAPGKYAATDERRMAAHVTVEHDNGTEVRAEFNRVDRQGSASETSVAAELSGQITQDLRGSIGLLHSDKSNDPSSLDGEGRRTDVGIRLTRQFPDDFKAWAFGQSTVLRSKTRERNDRIGAGFELRLSDQVTVSAEGSYGTSGIAGLAKLDYKPNQTDNYYLGYRLDPDTTAGDRNGYDPFGRDYGAFLVGANRRINDLTDAYFEQNYDFIGAQRSLTHTYGIKHRPDDVTTISAGLEAGRVYDPVSGNFERFGVSFGSSRKLDDRDGSIRLEARFENGIGNTTRDKQSYLLSGHYGHNFNDDWRFIGKIDTVLSRSDQATILDGDYVEGSVGWAYRAKEDDRWNALMRYTYLEDLPGAQQVNVQNQLSGPRQRSHVFEADAIYQLNKHLSLGGKYGLRTGQVESVRGSNNFENSMAQLLIGRADIHVVKNWDVVLEGRALWLDDIDQNSAGFLAGVYRHLGDNAKVGVGYNFTNFSDDLTDLSQDDSGLFLNVIGKF